MSQLHRAWQGEDAPEECVECGQRWPCVYAWHAERERANRLARAIAAGSAALLSPETVKDLADMREEGRV